MTTRRLSKIRFSVSGLLLLTSATAFSIHSCRPLNTVRFTEINNGMSLDEVKHILGGSPGNYGWKPSLLCTSSMTLEGWHPTLRDPPKNRELQTLLPGDQYKVHRWTDARTMLEVAFNKEGYVIGKHKRARFSREFIWRR